MLLHFSHIGFVFYSVYCLAILLFLSDIYIFCGQLSHLPQWNLNAFLRINRDVNLRT